MPVVPLRASEIATPSVAPTEAATPQIHVNAPLEAFGGAMAEGVKNLGKGLGDLGNELFSRAMAMQDLTNETNAKNANIDFMGTAGMLHAKYSELQGEARVAAFPKYMADLKAAYNQHRTSLGNPMAMRMFDGAAVSTLNRSIFNAAGAAATAQREASLTAATDEFNLTSKQVYSDPNDEAAFQDAIKKSNEAAATKAAMSPGGATPKHIKFLQAQGQSELAYNRIIGMARNEPNKAYDLLHQYESQNLIFGQHDIAARNKVESLISTTGMNVVANQTLQKYLQPDGTYSKSAGEMQAEAVTQAQKMYPDMAGIGTAAQSAFDRNYNQHAWSETQDTRMRTQQVSEQIVKGAQTVDQLPPDLVKQMKPSEIKKFPADANAYQRSEQVQTDRLQYTGLLGLYNNDNAKFMDTNIYQVPGISKGNINFFLGLQRRADANGDPRVARAMTWLKGAAPGVLDDIGVTGPNKDREASNQFVGALHEAIQSYQETNGHPPDEKVLTKEIFPALTKEVTQKGWLWNSQTPFFKADIPAKYKEDYLRLSPLANDFEIRRAFTRQLFDQFFKSQATTSGKIQGRVGQ